MITQRIEGWIFDAYPDKGGMRLWIITPEGEAVTCIDPWMPKFYVADSFRTARACIDAQPYPVTLRHQEKMEIFSGRVKPVLEIRVPPFYYASLVKQLLDQKIPLYDGDIPLAQSYHYDRGHFPLARCVFDIHSDGHLLKWHLLDDPWAVDYTLPPLRYMHLYLTGSEVSGRLNPNHAIRGSLAMHIEDSTRLLEGTTKEQLTTLVAEINRFDPDIITTEWGDSQILPRLLSEADRLGITIPFSRDSHRQIAKRPTRSFMSYGQTIYQAGAKFLFGRWHLDLKNSFYIKECGLEGLYEIARVAKIPVQRASRSTIGTALTSMQMAKARELGILIPMDKQQVEDFRPASELTIADKGGLVYAPKMGRDADCGWFENIAEYDFVSMYPQLMVSKNISPETVNCKCCPTNKVPEIGHHLCQRRKGLVPNVLAPILDKRAKYKTMAREMERRIRRGEPVCSPETDSEKAKIYKNCAAAFKWVLVCCFGYLGFKNARFGKIESHECVTAWGRETLLRAKEAVEALGFELIHANVDALYIQCNNNTDYEKLRQTIECAAGCPVGLEGVYRWLRFCPGRGDPQAALPNKYFGVFETGEVKMRGIALRRDDTPRMIKEMQSEVITALSKAGNLKECTRMQPELEEIVQKYRWRLIEGNVRPDELAIAIHLSKDPSQYCHDTLSSLAAKRLVGSGVRLHAGEQIQYVVLNGKEKVKPGRVMPLSMMEVLEYDREYYLKLLYRAADEIVSNLFGRAGTCLKLIGIKP